MFRNVRSRRIGTFYWIVACAVLAPALAFGGILPQGILPQGILPQGILPQGILPQGILPQGILPQGILPQGILPQGILPQGILPQGILPQGILPQGVALMGGDLLGSDGKGALMLSVTVRGTTAIDQSKPPVELTSVPGLSTGTGNYITVEGQSAVGHYAVATMGDSHGVPISPPETLDLYIAGAMRDPNPNVFHDPAEQDNEDELYTVYFFHKWSGQWISLCPYDARTHAASAMAIPEDRSQPNNFIFACTATGVDAKCARNWGYRPWAYAHTWVYDMTINNGPNASPGGWVQRTEDLKPFYDLCKVAARAAYCQDEKSYTKNGTLVDLFDTRHVIWPNAFESPFSALDMNSRWMMAQEYFISDTPPITCTTDSDCATGAHCSGRKRCVDDGGDGVTCTLPFDCGSAANVAAAKGAPLLSALQRTRYRELSPSAECAEFANIDRLERDDIEDGRWAGVLNNENSLQIFSPTACTHNEREPGPTTKPLPWDCSPCTTKVCQTNPECCGAGSNPGWTDACRSKAAEVCKDANGTPWPVGLVWPRDLKPALTATIPPKYLLGAGGAVLRVDAPVPPTATVATGTGATVSGWACDPEWPGATVPVAIYNGPRENGGTLLGTVRADQAVALPLSREVSAACDGPGRDYAQHGFSYTLPASQTGDVFVYAIDEATEDGPAAPPTLVRNGIVPVPTCPHSETVEGAPLASSCSDCVKSVCTAHQACCIDPPISGVGWDSTCTLAASTCAAGTTSSVVNEQNVAIVATGWVEPIVDGPYAFGCGADPSRLWVNGQKLCDTWPGAPPPGGGGPIVSNVSLMAGTRYHIRWDRYHLGAPLPAPVAGLQWMRLGGGNQQLSDIPTERLYQLAPGGGTGLAAAYTGLAGGGGKLSRIDAVVDINNDVLPPSQTRITLPSPPILTPAYQATWEGEVVPAFSESYTFSVVGAGIPQLIINGDLVPIAGPPGLNPPSGSCAANPGGHSVCDVGDKLAHSTATVAACDPCVDIICAPDKDPFCCDGGYESYYSRELTWDAKCVAEAKAYCPTVGCSIPPVTGLTPERKATPKVLQAGVHYHIKLQYDNSIDQNTGAPPTDQTVRLLWASARQMKEVIPQYALYPKGGTSTAVGSGLNVTYFTTKNTNGVLELDQATAAGATPSVALMPDTGPLGIPNVDVLAPTGLTASQTQLKLPPPILVRPRFEDVIFSDGEVVLEGKGGVPGSWVDVAFGTVNPLSPNGIQAGPIVASATVGNDGTFGATVTAPSNTGTPNNEVTLVLVQRPQDLTTCAGLGGGSSVRCSYPLDWPLTLVPPKSDAVLEITSPHNSTHIPNPQANVLAVHGTGTSAPVTVTEIFDNGGSILSQSLVTSPDGIISGTLALSAATLPTSDTAGDPNTGWHWLLFSQGDASQDSTVGPFSGNHPHPVFVTVGILPPTVGFPRSGAHLDCEAVPEIDPLTGEQTIRIEGKLPYAEAAFGALRVFEETGRGVMREIPVPLCNGGGALIPCPGDRVVDTVPGPDGLFAFKMAVIPGPGKHVFRVFQAPDPPGTLPAEMHFRAFATVANTPTSQLVVNVAPRKFDFQPGTGPFIVSNAVESGPLPGLGLRVNGLGSDRFELQQTDGDCSPPAPSPLCAVPSADVNVKVGSRVYTARARSSGAWSLNIELPVGWNDITFSQVMDSLVGGAWSESCPSAVVEIGTTDDSGADHVEVTPSSQNVSVDAISPEGAVATFEVSALLKHSSTVVRPVAVLCDHPSGSIFPIGTTSVLCTARDAASGLTGIASVNVRVRGHRPVLHLPPEIVDVAGTLILTEEATSPMGAMVAYDVTALDGLDLPLEVTCSPSPPAQFPVTTGPDPLDGTANNRGTPVFCEATDGDGRSSRVDFRVKVIDTTAPIVTPPGPITVDAAAGGTAVVTYAATAYDLVAGNIVPTCTPASGSPFAVGTTTVGCSAKDDWNNVGTASFTVTVRPRPNTPPVVTPSPNLTVEATGPAGAVVAYAASASDAEDGALTPTCAPASGSAFAVGTTLVTCTASDSGGLTGSATFTVTVRDTTPPVLTLPAPITTTAGARGEATVTFTATATDLVSGVVPVTCAPPSGSAFTQGTTTVACGASDGAGNPAAGSFTVTVSNTPPVVTVPADITVEATSASGAQVPFKAIATDAQDGSRPVTCTPAAGATFAIGTTTVTCAATDTGGLTGSASFYVTVKDSKGPAFANVPGTIVVYATSTTGAKVSYTKPTATDAVDGARPVTCTPVSGAQFAVNKTTVTCSASDTRGNPSTVTFTVWVQYQAPTDGTFFLFPIRSNGSSIFHVGRPVPVRFKLLGASAPIANLVAKLTVSKLSSAIQGTLVDTSDETVDDTDFLFKYRSVFKWYAYRWKTRDQTQGTYRLTADLGDGVVHQINVSLKTP